MTDGNGAVRWGWLGKSVAATVIVGFPSLILLIAAVAVRAEHRFTLLEENQRMLAEVASRTLTRVETHEDWARAQREDMMRRLDAAVTREQMDAAIRQTWADWQRRDRRFDR